MSTGLARIWDFSFLRSEVTFTLFFLNGEAFEGAVAPQVGNGYSVTCTDDSGLSQTLKNLR